MSLAQLNRAETFTTKWFMILRSPTENENGAVSLRLSQASSPSMGEDRDGGAEAKSNITPTLPSPSRGRNEKAVRSAFSSFDLTHRKPIFEGGHEVHAPTFIRVAGEERGGGPSRFVVRNFF
jgi:hypothetical protein